MPRTCSRGSSAFTTTSSGLCKAVSYRGATGCLKGYLDAYGTPIMCLVLQYVGRPVPDEGLYSLRMDERCVPITRTSDHMLNLA